MWKTVVIVLLGAMLIGCESSPWRDAFSGDPDAFEPTREVAVRLVSPEQVDDYRTQFEEFLEQERVAREDATPEHWQREREIMLDVFRYHVVPDEVVVVGEASFATTSPPRRGDSSMIKFAKSVGADVLFLSVREGGVVRDVELRPGFNVGIGTGGRGTHGHVGTTVYPRPVNRQGFVVETFFLRHLGAPELAPE